MSTSRTPAPPAPPERVVLEGGALVCRFCAERLERIKYQPADHRRRPGPAMYDAPDRAEAPKSRYGVTAKPSERVTPSGLLTMHEPAS